MEDIVFLDIKKSEGNVIGTLSGSVWNNKYIDPRRVFNVETYAPTLQAAMGMGGGIVPKILEGDASMDDVRIRKLTPRECFRLMGVKDEDIDKIMKAGLSNSSMYKMAGNSIVIDVLNSIHLNLFDTND